MLHLLCSSDSNLPQRRAFLITLLERCTEAQINEKNSSGHSPLFYAIGLEKDDLATILLSDKRTKIHSTEVESIGMIALKKPSIFASFVQYQNVDVNGLFMV